MLTQTREQMKWLFGVLTTVVLILGAVWLVDAFQPGTRAHSQKEAILRGGGFDQNDRMPASVKGEQGKGGSQLSISFEEGTQTGSGVLNLKALIESHVDQQDLKFQWMLPDGVTMAAGSNEGDVGSLTAGETKSLEASLLVPTGVNKQIHLQVYSMVNGERMGDVAQYNTVKQLEIDRTIASKLELLESGASEGTVQKPKLIH